MFNFTRRLFLLRSPNVWSRPCFHGPILFPARLYSQINLKDNTENNNEERNSPAQKKGDEDTTTRSIDPLRLCIQGLSPFVKDRDLLKFCRKEFDPPIQLEAIAKSTKKSHAFLKFIDDKEKERFEKEAPSKKFKRSSLSVKPVWSDSYGIKFERSIEYIEKQTPKIITDPTKEDIKAEMAVSVRDRISPLWKVPYEEQITIKKEVLTNMLKKINTLLVKHLKKEKVDISQYPSWLNENPESPCCEVTEIIEADSDKLLHYRNKAEFTIGKSYLENGKSKVGFNVGNFNKGFVYVEDPGEESIISKEALQLAKILEKYVQESDIPLYDRINHNGFWRNFIVRQSEKTKEILLSIAVAKQNLDENQCEKVKKELVETFISSFKNSEYKIVSILMQEHNGKADKVPEDGPIEILYGERDHYMDEMLGSKFRVNVSAFTQTNSYQCEKLYGLIKKLANIDQNTIFLDICCGIGTIGMCVAREAKQIVGIELVKRAVSDAQYNSKLNGLKNTLFYANKVEDIIHDLVKSFDPSSELIGVVDPPRAGVHKDVISALRVCKGLNKIIYVSCNPEGMTIDNLVQLCVPQDKKRKGSPFKITQAYGVDLFPQTNHIEGVFVLEREISHQNENK